MEIKGTVNGIIIYDDFAHHPTAIATTLAGLRAKVGKERIIAVLEFGSYTMKSGVHKDHILDSLVDADLAVCKTPDGGWNINLPHYKNADELVKALVPQLKSGDHVLVMSNSGFEGIHQKLLGALLSKS
jgi:UDP-N-acetylmuramate: L-alanyl-gamma-D-glutamyl-meso-diaminopimelate ligase